MKSKPSAAVPVWTAWNASDASVPAEDESVPAEDELVPTECRDCGGPVKWPNEFCSGCL